MLESAEALPDQSTASKEYRSGADICREFDLANLPEKLSEGAVNTILDQVKVFGEEICTDDDLSRTLTQLSRTMRANREQRLQFPDDPAKFLQSEVELDECIKKLHAVALIPELMEAFASNGGCAVLISLMSHVNEDIAVEVIKVLADLTDESVVEFLDHPEVFVQSPRDCSAPAVLSMTLGRLAEYSSESVAACLQVILNMLDISPNVASDFTTTDFLGASVAIVGRAADPTWMYSRSSAAEVLLAVLEFSTPEELDAIVSDQLVNALLTTVAVYRKQEPNDSLEREFFNNLIACLCSVCKSDHIRQIVGQLHGVELFAKFVHSPTAKLQRTGLKLVVNAIRDNTTNCNAFVDQLGLKVAGSYLTTQRRDVLEHTVSIFQFLLKNTAGVHQTRTLSKLVENSYGKLITILKVVAAYLPAIAADTPSDQALTREEDYLRKCELGLFILQQAALVVLRVFNIGNTSARKCILQELRADRVNIQDLVMVLSEYILLLNQGKALSEVTELREFLIIFQAKSLLG